MINNIDITKILFLDVECVSAKPSYGDLDETFQQLWAGKSRGLLRRDNPDPTEEDIAASYSERAGIYAEFGKIVCISVGFMARDTNKKLLVRLKSFADDDESVLLKDFCQLLNQYYNNPNYHYLCGHNIKEFDVPYICRRLVVNQIPFPNLLQIHGKKPWETKYLLDTLALWKFGDYKNYTSLKLLAAALGFPSPKDDIDGSDVGRVYWEEKDLPRIAHYCEKDVLATVQLFLRFRMLPLLEGEQVIHVGAAAAGE
ncbi:MAG TPA: 3'-5' exonuclease [Bacteroidetes bacterium]|nr:3'-5' exonuclease [Bacteroidota bacterium]